MSTTASTLDPADYWLRSWRALWQLAPQNLVQPILPGWTLNINSNNSSSPQTEAEVLARHSYGRQLGRMADALAVLVEAQPKALQQARAVRDFVQMKNEIDAIKTQGASQRIEQLAKDVERLLEQADQATVRELRAALRRALGEG